MLSEYFNYNQISIEYTKLPGSFLKKLWRRLTVKPYQVVYLHGFNDPYQNHFDLLSLAARKGFDVYPINLPIHGHSEDINSVSWDFLIELVTGFIRLKNLHRPILWGFSMGGGVALKILERGELPIHSLKLLCPFCYVQSLDSLQDAFRLLSEGADLVGKGLVSDKAPPLNPVSDITKVLIVYGPMLLDFHLDLQNNRVPIRVVAHDKDRVINAEKVREALGKVPHLTMQVLPNMTHDIYYISNAEQNAIIDALFS